MNVESLEIDARFCGPPNSGNGGYVCGRIAKHLRGTVSVRLEAPPPLHTPLRREWSDDHARLLHGSTLIGEPISSKFRRRFGTTTRSGSHHAASQHVHAHRRQPQWIRPSSRSSWASSSPTSAARRWRPT